MNESFTVNGTMGTHINESGVYSLVFGNGLHEDQKMTVILDKGEAHR